MNTNLAYTAPVHAAPKRDNLLVIDFKKSSRRTTSLYKSNGAAKASAAEPIRSIEDIKAIQQYFLDNDQLRNYTLFTIGITFGLRAGDLLSLRMHHIFMPDGRFKSHCDLIESKTRKFNNPAITPEIQQLLTAYIKESNPDFDYDDPLFISKKRNFDGSPKPITLRQLNYIMKDAATACNVPGHISSHSLRKTFAYHMIKSNPNSDEAKFAVQTMLNHADFKTTLAYCGITQDEVDSFRSGLSTLFAAPASI